MGIEWFEEERGNRVTSNNVQGLMTKLTIAYQQSSAQGEQQEETPKKE